MKRFLSVLASLPLLAPANDAALNDGSEGPEPIGWRSGAESIIQMKSEHLDIRFGVDTTRVKARFTFLSHKTSGPARQKLGFPDASRSDLDGDVIGPIENLVTRVNGEVVESELASGYYREIVKPDGSVFYEKRAGPEDEDGAGFVRRHAWHVIEVEFPPGKEIVVERDYECPTGMDTTMNAFFIYETRTGGAWKDEIERLTAEVTFADDVNTEFVTLDPREGWRWTADRSMATLEWKNFEPRLDENRSYFEITTLNLPRIREVAREHEDFPPVEDWIANWRRMHGAR